MSTTNEKTTYVLIKTELGDIKIKLYNETPKHRDNFIKLVKEGYFNGTLFHRVIKGFMIQGGDPDSKGAPAGKSLGTGGPEYNIPAEIVYPQYFHKRGALAAARQADQVNPERESSGSQFYIVWGDTYNDGQIKQIEKNLRMMKENEIFNQLAAENKSLVMDLRRSRDQAGLQELQEKLISQTKDILKDSVDITLSPEQIQVYKDLGGTPHLDGQYTVFGEVIEGLDIVEKIQAVETGRADRPKEDVVIDDIILEA